MFSFIKANVTVMAKQKKYIYDFPENKEIAEQLEKGDRGRIATASGFTFTYINDIFKGKRRMPESVKEIANIIININKQRKEALQELSV